MNGVIIKDTSIPVGGIFDSKTYDISNIEQLIKENKIYPSIKTTDLSTSHTESHKEQYHKLIQKYNNPIVIDFGGGLGINYSMIPEIKSKYYIVETEETCKFSEDYPRFTFITDIFSIKEPIDIFYSNGGIQYALDIFDIINYIDNVLIPKHILIHRVVFTPKESYITKQRGIEVFTWIFNLQNFVSKFSHYTYQILSEYDFPPYSHTFGSYGEYCDYIPILFTRTNT